MAAARIHSTAIVEDGVEVGEGTAIWDHVHVRGPARIGRDCIVGGKTYVAYGVEIGDRVKINSFVYLCAGVTLEDGVMVAARTTFTNDRFPRAVTSDLRRLLPSEAGEALLQTRVRAGASIGAAATIGPGLEIGRFAMVGMGSVVTRPVPDFHLVAGQPARPLGLVCRCGEPLLRFDGDVAPDQESLACKACSLLYAVRNGEVVELRPPA